jgi:6-phosphogluconolactonase
MPRPVTVTYRVFASPAATARAGAQLFSDTVVKAATARGVARIAISGGTTPKSMFQLLADPAEPFLKQVPWDQIELYWVDERCVPPDNAESNYRMTKEALLSKVPLPADRVHRMDGEL